jgi:hypothetical protein
LEKAGEARASPAPFASEKVMTDEEKKKMGLGCGEGGAMAVNLQSAQNYLEMGLPRIALARLRGVNLAPKVVVVKATFDTPDVQVLPSKSQSEKMAQDYVVDQMIVRITEDSPAQNVLTAQSRYYNQFMNGIEATLDVQGAPRFTVANDFTPLSILADVINEGAPWPGGWGLTYQQQVFMSFQSTFQLPNFPTTVNVGFRLWGPTGEEYEHMTTQTAIEYLQACGLAIPKCYQMYCK